MKSILLILTLLIPALSLAGAATRSAYTSIATSDCVTSYSSEWEQEPTIDSLATECPGLGGYRPLISGGDLRYDLDLRFEDKLIEPLRLPSFHEPGSDKIEWRFSLAANEEIQFHALIYRLSYQDYDADSDRPRDTSMLVVVRLNGAQSCLLGTVPASRDMNGKARRMADDLTLACRGESD